VARTPSATVATRQLSRVLVDESQRELSGHLIAWFRGSSCHGTRGHTHRQVPNGHLVARAQPRHCRAVIAYAVVDDALSPDFPLGVGLEVFVRREDAERFIEGVRGDDPEVAAKLRIEERELDVGGLN